ncbi:MAG: ATP-binding protein [Armatimonadota bacterium]|nr:ATP-binding protein [Armatimonadota bacterium]
MTIRRFFQLVYGLFFVLLIAIGTLAVLLYVNEVKLINSQRIRFESYLLADELRQSSDDMTRFVRSYVVTGDPKYKRMYYEVLAIRKGKKPRPEHYNRIYWDFIAAGIPVKTRPGEALSLQARMSRLGFSDAEFHKLNEAQRLSDALAKRENAAMHVMLGWYDDGTGHFRKRGKPNRELAISMVYDAAYEKLRARAMKPINDFYALLDRRTSRTAEFYTRRGFLYLELIFVILTALWLLTIVSSVMIAKRVTSRVSAIEKQTEMVAADIDALAGVAASIADGNLSEQFELRAQHLNFNTNDEIGQLARVQNHMIDRLKEAGDSIARITAELREDALELEAHSRQIEESYKKLRELESLRDSLTHMIVHDMRTPLTSIYGYLEMLREFESKSLSQEGREYLSIVMGETQNLMEMISSLLDVSKMEHGEMQLDLSEFDITELVKEIAAKLEPLREDRSIILDFAETPLLVTADRHLIGRVIQNLLSNALKFTPSPGGEIRLRAERQDGSVKVCVIDNGPGVPKEYHEKIFEKFGQVESRQNRQKYSTGLGLTFCKLAVEAHGGRIGIESEPGKGSTFWFTLPVNRT